MAWEGFEKIQVKKGMKLNEIWLDGNPLCINLNECEYIKRIDNLIPSIRKVVRAVYIIFINMVNAGYFCI